MHGRTHRNPKVNKATDLNTLRTFYWHDRVVGRFTAWRRRHIQRRQSAWRDFATGNAGDIFAVNIIKYFYPGLQPENCSTGPRLLCVGSIGHKVENGDVLCGVGSKEVLARPEVSRDSVLVHALRGPISHQILEKDGFDTSAVAWYGDPGLIISELLEPCDPQKGRVIFVPHYRERGDVASILPKGIEVVDIDADPLVVGRKIQQAELVYSSSLHGIIFAHALGRPVKMVVPATEEPLSKFEDYYLGVGLKMPTPLGSIADANFTSAPNSPATLSVAAQDLVFPDLEVLRSRGIAA